jgi:hypothetical protein
VVDPRGLGGVEDVGALLDFALLVEVGPEIGDAEDAVGALHGGL